jgi:hypothetical protein
MIIRPHKFIKYDGKHGAEVYCEFCGLIVHAERTLSIHKDAYSGSAKGCPTSNLLTAEEQLQLAKIKAKDENNS